MKSVLFVCTGNVCRSPIAEGLFRRLLGNRKDIEVASAGVHAVRGQPPSSHAIEVCVEEGAEIGNLRSQPLTGALVERATHIFAMTGAHVEAIQMLFPNAADKTFLLREFEEPGATCWRDVPDPIGLGRDVYNTCAETIKNALPSVLAFVEESQVAVRPSGRSSGPSIYIASDILHSAPSNLNAPSGGLCKVDPEIFDAVTAEEKRQRENIELIASENFTSRAVMEAQGSVLTNKYAEGLPKKRWYGGCENVDTVEQLAIDRAKRLFNCEHVNVQPHNLYLHSSVVQTRKFERTLAGKREAIKFATIDSTGALMFALFINAAILILAATVFHWSGHQDVADIRDAYRLFSPLLGVSIASSLFAVALLASGQNSTLTGTLAGQIVMEGFLNIRIKPWLRRLITRLIAIIPAVLVIGFAGESKTTELLVASQVVLSMQLGFAVWPLMRFTSEKAKLGDFSNKLWLKILGWTTTLIIITLNVKLLFDTFMPDAVLKAVYGTLGLPMPE